MENAADRSLYMATTKEATMEGATTAQKMRIARYFLGPLARGIVQDYRAAGFNEPDGCAFALRLLDSAAINTKESKAIFGKDGKHTYEAIYAACEAAIAVHNQRDVVVTQDVNALVWFVWNETLLNGGHMGLHALLAFIGTFGQDCREELRVFWNHLGVTTDETGMLPTSM